MTVYFAEVSELADFLGITIPDDDSRALLVLAGASAAVQEWTGQTIALVEDDTVTLRGTWTGYLQLPQLPVVSVAECKIEGVASDFILRPGGVLTHGVALEVMWGPDPDAGDWGGPGSTVTVKYTHGYDEIPESVKLATLSIASRLWERPDAPAQNVGYASAGAAVAADGLTLVEKALLKRYRPLPATVLT